MITIRRIRVNEGALFRQVRLAALHESPNAFATTYTSARERSAESWSTQADATAHGADRATFLAFANDVPIGITALYRQNAESDTAELLQMWVAPEYRKRGVAVTLLDTVFEWASVQGFQRVVAQVMPGNTRALLLYRTYGFMPVDTADHDGSAITAVVVKTVKSQQISDAQ